MELHFPSRSEVFKGAVPPEPAVIYGFYRPTQLGHTIINIRQFLKSYRGIRFWKVEVRNRRQKFLKVGQKFRSRRDVKRGLCDSEEELKKGEMGYKKNSDSSEKREKERETYVNLTNVDNVN